MKPETTRRLSDLISDLERARAQSATLRRKAEAHVARQLKPALSSRPHRRKPTKRAEH